MTISTEWSSMHWTVKNFLMIIFLVIKTYTKR